MGAKIFSALRGGAITSDATVEDGERVGIGNYAEVVEACPDTLGISWEEMTPYMRKLIEDVDLIVSKGLANYYVLISHKDSIKAPFFSPQDKMFLYIKRVQFFSKEHKCGKVVVKWM